jgi:hypothetical protein
MRDQEGEGNQINLRLASDGARPALVGMFVDIGKYLVTGQDYLIRLHLIPSGRRCHCSQEKGKSGIFSGEISHSTVDWGNEDEWRPVSVPPKMTTHCYLSAYGGSEASPVEYVKIKIQDAFISSIAAGGPVSDGRLTEEITQNFSKVNVDTHCREGGPKHCSGHDAEKHRSDAEHGRMGQG